ncbi:MAG: U32 family peptidase [Clostridia bacterium]|nr:U32 family peptidase [Clostridia bacterium]
MLELLMPAGNLKKLKTAFHFGADAVYLGGKDFSLRAFADNFTEEEIKEGINFAHNLGKKVYVTANIFAKNADIDKARDYFVFLEQAGADAILISDIGLVSLCRECAPNLNIHLSTQANTTNMLAVKFWYSLGIKRVVLARELSFDEISEIHREVPQIELEAFVHGAMCMSFSGRCFLSSYFSGRSANRGECIQPCRWNYRLTETERHADKPLDLEEDERCTYFMNSRDLRLLGHIPEIAAAGVVSLKVEGRMKSEFYVATVANAYRHAIDEYLKEGKIINTDKYNASLETVSHRTYTDAYFDGDNPDTVCLDEGISKEKYVFTAVVLNASNGKITVEMRNRFKTGENALILSPDDSVNGKTFTIGEIYLPEKEMMTDDAKLVQHIYEFSCPYSLNVGDIILEEKTN